MKTRVCAECGRDFKISGAEFYIRNRSSQRSIGSTRCSKCRTSMEHMLDVVDYMERVDRRRTGRTSASDGVDGNANRV